MGRPKKEQDATRVKLMQVRLKESEFDEFRQAADSSGLVSVGVGAGAPSIGCPSRDGAASPKGDSLADGAAPRDAALSNAARKSSSRIAIFALFVAAFCAESILS